MKIINEIKNTELNLDVLGNIAGFRGTKAELNHEDLVDLLSLDDGSLRNRLDLTIRPRLIPLKMIEAISEDK